MQEVYARTELCGGPSFLPIAVGISVKVKALDKKNMNLLPYINYLKIIYTYILTSFKKYQNVYIG